MEEAGSDRSPDIQNGGRDQGGWQSPTFLAVANITDGMLDEGGFTVVGGGTEQRSAKWENIIEAMLHVQSAGKGYYIVNECKCSRSLCVIFLLKEAAAQTARTAASGRAPRRTLSGRT